MTAEQNRRMQEIIARLFSPGRDGLEGEAAMDGQVEAMIAGFLTANETSSQLAYNVLASSFTDTAIPGEPADIERFLQGLGSRLVAHSTHTGSPRFIGHMTSMLPFFVRPIAKLAVAMNQNVVKAETAKAATPFERQAIAMLHRLVFNSSSEFYDHHVQQTRSTLGAITSGGTLANFHALWCARNRGLGSVETEGLTTALAANGYNGAVIIGSALMHYSLEKAAGLLGLGTKNLIKVPVDRCCRVDCTAMRRAVEQALTADKAVIALIAVAGSTDTGAVDSISEIGALAREFGIHFHVDAAWGGPVLFSARHRHKLTGLEQADTVTIDGHKQLYTPIGVGVVLFRDPALAKATEKQARYIIRPTSVDLGRRTIEGSRPNTALYLHAGLSLIGAGGYEYLIDQGIRRAADFAARLSSRPEFELLHEPELNIVVYRYIPESQRTLVAGNGAGPEENEFINRCNTALQKRQRERGRSFVSRTLLATTRYGAEPGIVALRAVLANPLTTIDDIEAILDEQIEIGALVSASSRLHLSHGVSAG